MKNKILLILSKMEVVIPAILFLTMLISCGLFLNVKMNGKNAALPSLPEKEKRLIMRSESNEDTSIADDLIEPVFVGVKNDNAMIAATIDNAVRKNIESVIYSPLVQLFSGSSNEKVFDSTESRTAFIEKIKNGKEYMFISFYTDIPSSAFLPCIVTGFDFENNEDVYNIRNMFLLPDEEGNLYAIALSSDKKIYEIFPSENIPFTKINIETYDISDGWYHFEFPLYGEVIAEISDSVTLSKYKIDSLAGLYGKDKDAEWIDKCFETFSVNSNLVKSFTSADESTVNYVEETSELIVDDNGFVEYKALDDTGINLEEYLGYVPNVGVNFSFSDKILAIKKIVNNLKVYNDNISYSFSGFEQEKKSNTLKVYFKIFSDGILVTENSYDAVFEIKGNSLVHAKYMAVICSKINETHTVMPQKYADVLLRGDDGENSFFDVYCPVMVKDEKNDDSQEENTMSVHWARISSSSEVSK